MSENTGSGLGIVLGFLGLVALASYLNKKRCPQCGYENLGGAIICYHCGGHI
ncbi:hypothetical protein GOV13_00110 [Candidatus Pacearchaeota archaeon]|nr:hypothetical protein [Candidatus Pacearchaeota archaeon]